MVVVSLALVAWLGGPEEVEGLYRAGGRHGEGSWPTWKYVGLTGGPVVRCWAMWEPASIRPSGMGRAGRLPGHGTPAGRGLCFCSLPEV
jgi:hypothetical protein